MGCGKRSFFSLKPHVVIGKQQPEMALGIKPAISYQDFSTCLVTFKTPERHSELRSPSAPLIDDSDESEEDVTSPVANQLQNDRTFFSLKSVQMTSCELKKDTVLTPKKNNEKDHEFSTLNFCRHSPEINRRKRYHNGAVLKHDFKKKLRE